MGRDILQALTVSAIIMTATLSGVAHAEEPYLPPS
jgi:hypothetical protein